MLNKCRYCYLRSFYCHIEFNILKLNFYAYITNPVQIHYMHETAIYIVKG